MHYVKNIDFYNGKLCTVCYALGAILFISLYLYNVYHHIWSVYSFGQALLDDINADHLDLVT